MVVRMNKEFYMAGIPVSQATERLDAWDGRKVQTCDSLS